MKTEINREGEKEITYCFKSTENPRKQCLFPENGR
jgi:hypothetical protein